MGLEEYKGVFVFAQQVDNTLNGVAFELLGKGKELAKDLNTEVTAVLIGSDVKGLVRTIPSAVIPKYPLKPILTI